MRSTALLFTLLAGSLGCNGLVGHPQPDRSMADGEEHGLPTEVDLPSWVQSGDDFIEGTIVEVRAAWSPLVKARRGGGTEPFLLDECAKSRPAMDLVLTDLKSVRSGEPPATLTVRLGHVGWGSLAGFSQPTVEPGEPAVTGWFDEEPTFTEGMRVGGPIYWNPGHPDPVFPTGMRAPIYRLLDDSAAFSTNLLNNPYPPPYSKPLVDPLEGLSPDALWQQIVTFANYPYAPYASAYREHRRLHDPEATSLYAAFCGLTRDQAENMPCEDTGDACR